MWKWSIWQFHVSFCSIIAFSWSCSQCVFCKSYITARLRKKTLSHFKTDKLAFPGWKRQLLQFQLKELLGLGRQRPTSEISFSGIYEDQVITSSFSFFSNWLLLMLWKHCAVFVLRMEEYVQAVDGWWNEPDWPYSWGNAYMSFLLWSCIQWYSPNLYEL